MTCIEALIFSRAPIAKSSSEMESLKIESWAVTTPQWRFASREAGGLSHGWWSSCPKKPPSLLPQVGQQHSPLMFGHFAKLGRSHSTARFLKVSVGKPSVGQTAPEQP